MAENSPTLDQQQIEQALVAQYGPDAAQDVRNYMALANVLNVTEGEAYSTDLGQGILGAVEQLKAGVAGPYTEDARYEQIAEKLIPGMLERDPNNPNADVKTVAYILKSAPNTIAGMDQVLETQAQELVAQEKALDTLAAKLTPAQIGAINGVAETLGGEATKDPREALEVANAIVMSGATLAQALGIPEAEFGLNAQGENNISKGADAINAWLVGIRAQFDAEYGPKPTGKNNTQAAKDARSEAFEKFLEKGGFPKESYDQARKIASAMRVLDEAGVDDIGRQPVGAPEAVVQTPVIDEKTRAAMATVNGVLPALDITPSGDFKADYDTAMTKLAGLLNVDDKLTPAQIGQELEKTAKDPQYSAVRKTYDTVITVSEEMALNGAKLAINAAEGSDKFPAAIKSDPRLLFDIVDRRQEIATALAQIEASGILNPAQQQRAEVKLAATESAGQAPSVSPILAVAESKIKPEDSTPDADPAPQARVSISPAAVAVDAAAVKSIEQTLTGLGFNAGQQDGNVDAQFHAAAEQLRDAVFAVSGIPAKQGPVTADDITKIEQGIKTFKEHPDYPQLVALRGGQVPDGLDAKDAEFVKTTLAQGGEENRGLAMFTILSLKPSDMWKSMDNSMKVNMPAVVDVLENPDQMISGLKAVYASGAPASEQNRDEIEKAKAAQESEASRQKEVGELNTSVKVVEKATIEFGGMLDAMAGKLPFGITKESIGFHAPEAADGQWDATTQDATAKMVMGLKMAAFGTESNADGTYTPEIGAKLRKQIYTGEGEMVQMVRQEFGIDKMSKEDYAKNAEAFAKSTKDGQRPDVGNRLDTLIFSLDMIYENDPSRLNNSAAHAINRNNMMLDFAYENFLKNNPKLMGMIQGFFEGSQIGQIFGTLLGMKDIQVSRLWGDKGTDMTDPASYKDKIKEEYAKVLADAGGDHDKLKAEAKDALGGWKMGVVKKIFGGQLADLDESVNKALDAAKAAEANGQDPSEVFANSLIADAQEFRKNGPGLSVDKNTIENPAQTLPAEAQQYLSSNPTSPAAAVAATGGAGGFTPPDANAAQIDLNAAQSAAISGKPIADGEIMTVGDKSFEIIFNQDRRTHDQNPVRLSSGRVGELQKILADNQDKLGLTTKPESYLKNGQPTDMMTRNFSMALEELLIRAQLAAGRGISEIENKFDMDNIELVEKYMKDKGVDEASVTKFTGVLYALDADMKSIKGDPDAEARHSVLDQSMPKQIGVQLAVTAPALEDDDKPKPKDDRYPDLKGVTDDNRDIFERYKELNAGKRDPNCAPLVYVDENNEVHAAVVIEKTNEFKILDLPDFNVENGPRIVPTEVAQAFRENYNWRNPSDAGLQNYVERHLCLEPLPVEVIPAPAAEAKQEQKQKAAPAKPAEPTTVVADRGSGTVPQSYRDLPKLSNSELKGLDLYGGNMDSRGLDFLYDRAVSKRAIQPVGGFMITELEGADAKNLGADAIISVREQRGELPQHYLVNFDDHKVMDPRRAPLIRDLNPNDSYRGLDDFLRTPYYGMASVMTKDEMSERSWLDNSRGANNVLKNFDVFESLKVYGPFEWPVTVDGRVKMDGTQLQDWDKFRTAYRYGDGRNNDGFEQRKQQYEMADVTGGIDRKYAGRNVAFATQSGRDAHMNGRGSSADGGSPYYQTVAERQNEFNNKAGSCEPVEFTTTGPPIMRIFTSFPRAVVDGYRSEASKQQRIDEINQNIRDCGIKPGTSLKDRLEQRNQFERDAEGFITGSGRDSDPDPDQPGGGSSGKSGANNYDQIMGGF